jgi:hypothetical protein
MTSRGGVLYPLYIAHCGRVGSPVAGAPRARLKAGMWRQVDFAGCGGAAGAPIFRTRAPTPAQATPTVAAGRVGAIFRASFSAHLAGRFAGPVLFDRRRDMQVERFARLPSSLPAAAPRDSPTAPSGRMRLRRRRRCPLRDRRRPSVGNPRVATRSRAGGRGFVAPSGGPRPATLAHVRYTIVAAFPW